MSLPPPVMRRLMREITQLKNSPPEGIRVQTSEDNLLDLTGIIEGPEGTPYAGGYFRVKFKFNEEFPAAPPKCWFITKLFHPNVSSAGEICVNTLKKDWKATYGIEHILVTVKCLLIYPNPESALDEEAGKLLLEDYASYCSRAKLITSVHATPRVRPVEFDTPASEATASSESSSATASSSSTPSSSSKSSTSTPTAPFTLPIITRKSSSPAPAVSIHGLPMVPLKSSPGSNADRLGENDGATLNPPKERHISPSPSPLGTADANVALSVGVVPASNAPATLTPGTKAVKRAAGPGATGAEKRKKALKRL
ncbi:ubiquitin-conjugating enzyme/RWD-like protein [Roridomyces roridus]|uniref:E2 ubiquitin-conjugating enzyme n=1 Tax=Roridomyces roridus TaxID=1738132 RepID=A0AAD7BFR9_9AGAR|nr:ubiquitin-conjugating enzyme/RWD-like protein [Roridomyces roridus]